MKFKKQVAIEVTVGAFSFLIVAVLLALTTMLSEEMIFRKYVHVEILFESVGGLRVGDEVNSRGVIVGKVKEILLKADGAHVKVRFDVPMTMREDYRIEVTSGSILGGKALSIQEGSPAAPEISMDGLLKGSPSAELIDTATQAVLDIKKALEDGILDDLKASMAQIRKITTKMGDDHGTLSRLLADDKLYEEIQQSVANIRTISDAIAKGEGTVGKLVKSDDVYQQLQDTTANLKKITGGLAKGEGSMGKLLSDETLYQELQSLLREGRAVVDDYRETSPITTFTSIFFGAF
jgi:phospholipid/cholesterol/gamma-HCH transport system substrate-binding protein